MANMEIHVSVPQTVYLNSDQMINVTIETLKQLYNIPEHASIKKGYLIQWHNTHGSGYDEEMRKATDEDKMVLKMITSVREKKRK